MKTCCFFGHKDIWNKNDLLPMLTEIIEESILEGFCVFLFGGYGQFDSICHTAVSTLKQKYNHIKTVYVQAYYKPNENIDCIKSQYDEIDFPQLDTPARFAISKRNQKMIDMSDFCVFYVNHDWGGAYQVLRYARRKKKKLLNIFDKVPY